MVTTASMAPGLPTSPTPHHHLICHRPPLRNGFYHVLVLACILFSFTLSWLVSAGHRDLVSYAHGLQDSLVYDDDGDGCGAYEDDGLSAVYVQKSSQGCDGVKNVFVHPGSFCFLSTLAAFLVGGDSCQESSLENAVHSGSKSHPPLDELLDGTKVSCFRVDTNCGSEEGFASRKENFHCDDIGSCEGPLFSDAWIEETNGLDFPFHGTSEDIRSKVPNGSLLPHVNISPPFLDWGITHLYFPSKVFLTVANVHNDRILHIYKPFSTNSQYYALEFEQLSLAPGEATSIGFVFLPRWLGSSSAHLVLQTNFGGFIINAKGTAVDSPYRMQSLVGFDVASDGKLSKTLSMYNPLDDVMYIEELRALVSIFYENRSHTTCVVCRRKSSDWPSGDFNMLPNSNKWFSLEHGEFGQSLVGIRPHGLWELHPHNTESIIEISLFAHKEGNFSGAICMKFRSSSHSKHDTVLIPLEACVKDRIGYHTSSGSISVFLEPALPCKRRGSVFSLFVRNGASYLLHLVNIIEITDTVKLFEAKYMEGLILYPGTVTHVALVLYSSDPSSMEISTGMPAVSLNCKLAVVTNDSVSPQIEVPCEDLVKTCPRHESISGFVASEVSYVDFGLQHEEKQSTNARTGSLGNTGEEPLPMELSSLEGREVDELVLQNWRSHGTMVGMSVLEGHEVLFPMVQVGNYHSRWITVKNPSQKPVLMQLVLNSAVIVDQCKSVDALSEQPFVTRSVKMHSMRNVYGFSIEEAAIVEAFVHPLGTAEFGPITFHPSSRCMWRSSALIRNNLSGVEWLTLRGVGGFQSLILLEGSKPVQKLIFDLDLPTNLNVSSKEFSFHEGSSAACAHLFSKEVYAKNAGEFPIEVIKLDISGNSCGFNGFVVQNCKGFTLEPGESTRLLISFRPDFSAAVVHRDLELVMSTGILVIPVKASLPMDMLKLCRRPIVWTLLMKLFLVVLFTALVTILFCSLSHVSSIISEDFFMKRNKNIATVSMVGKTSRLHRNSKSARSFKEDLEPEAAANSKYPDCKSGIQDDPIKSQGKRDYDHPNKTLSSSSSTVTNMGEVDSSCTVETHQPDNLTIRVIKEKSRRKKRRAVGAGAGLAAKLEVSSSQSGNSTPSSPLSPGVCTPRQVWPTSPQASEHPFATGAELNHEKDEITLTPAKVHGSDVSMDCESSSVPSACEQPSLPEKPCGRPILLPSATFPGACRRAPGIVAPKASTSTSPIAPHARAPGSKLSIQKMAVADEGSASGEEFIYNIWGDHFCDHLLQRTRESPPRVSDASEGDSQSFFARDPQTLMMMSSARYVSPTPEQSFDVNYPLKKG